METIIAIILFAGIAIVAFRFVLPWHLRRTSLSLLGDTEGLRQEAARLRADLRARQDDRPGRKSAELYEELGSVMSALSLRSADTEAVNEAIASYRQAAEAYRAAGMDGKSSEAEFNLGAQLCELGVRSINSAELREADRLLASVLAPGKDEWPLRLPIQFCQAARASVLAALGVRLGDEKLFGDALPLCAASRGGADGMKLEPPGPAIDAIAGGTLTVVGRELADRAILVDAVDATRRAMEAKDDKGSPVILATSQVNLGEAMAALGEFDRKQEMLEHAVGLFEDSLEYFESDEWPDYWAGAMFHKGCALTALGKLTKDPEALSHALALHSDALGVFRAPYPRAATLLARGEAQLALADLRSDPDGAALAAESLSEAEAILRDGDLVGSLARVRLGLAAAEALKGG